MSIAEPTDTTPTAAAISSAIATVPVRRRAAQTFFFSILLAAIISTPLAAGVVAFRWAGIDHARLVEEFGSPALWSARSFLAYFDLFALAAWVPCACCISFVNARLRALSRPSIVYDRRVSRRG